MDDAILYLDMAATTPIHPEVLHAMQPFLTEQFANPSSLHSAGQVCKAAIDDARSITARYLNTTPAQIIFTSGGTESDNLAILGVMRALRAKGDSRGLIVSATEHSAVLEAVRYLQRYEGVSLVEIAPDAEGRLQPDALKQALSEHPTALVSIMHANNETGALNPILHLSEVAHRHDALFHTDAVQSFAKCPLDMHALPRVDYLSATAHKCGGPRGAGLFYMSPHAPKPHPVIIGGPQEQGLRGGTLNTAAIVGFGKAVALLQEAQQGDKITQLTEITARFLDALIPLTNRGLQVNTPIDPAQRVPGIINVSISNKVGDALVLAFDMRDIMVSSGSACHADRIEPSHVILAQTQNEARARSTLRFSFDATLTEEHIEQVLSVLQRQL